MRGFSFSIFSFVFLSFIIFYSSAQYMTFGPCPKLPAEPNFNITKYSGKWFEVEKFFFVFEATASCVSVEYFDKKDGTFGVEISMLEGLTKTRNVLPGITTYRSHDGSADFLLDLTITLSPIPFNVQFPYLVLATDYESYTMKWACRQLGPINMQNLWILSREKYLRPEARQAVYDKLRYLGVNARRLRPSNLRTCAR